MTTKNEPTLNDHRTNANVSIADLLQWTMSLNEAAETKNEASRIKLVARVKSQMQKRLDDQVWKSTSVVKDGFQTQVF